MCLLLQASSSADAMAESRVFLVIAENMLDLAPAGDSREVCHTMRKPQSVAKSCGMLQSTCRISHQKELMRYQTSASL